MTNAEFLQFHRDTIEKMHSVCERKNSDYTAGAGDAFFNFKVAEVFGVTSTEQGVFVRMTDKISRIATFIKTGVLKVSDESFEDTCLDLANYSIILAGMVREKKK